MPRYFLEVAYKGTRFSGFQVQDNAITVQSEIEHAFALVQRGQVSLTGSSRTDAGVHALQNFFHFDWETPLHPQLLYKMNAILPHDLVVMNIYLMGEEAHSRFEATGREYEYHIYKKKNPFLKEIAYHFPYPVNKEQLDEVAAFIKEQTNFWAFCKTNTQVKNFQCTISKSEWIERNGILIYNVAGNRFLRGMVRLLTATQLKVARGKYRVEEFKALFTGTEKCGFSVPAHGLFLKQVSYPNEYFPDPLQTI
ncbi:tRNA pseudouridine38-40 synthase [Cnuella takakiae]|uniref:tRNA pseudouridine synthase A n=1 Tax=Cnuella takakiae TaxID=1302690 RepID=A0A1M5ATK7_9BACT|nr:tRNA pseudouridine synthase A [Cnuella takakiae]OLY93219.1 tRNA pseudouridine(38-40) synthase TruA [Cnuella takakiae]SHF33476.1 tRNA pseudouridine38-40 synthase [Cnuella takakiae]